MPSQAAAIPHQKTTRSTSRRWQLWAACLLLAVMFAQLVGAATQLSATIDEGFHITSGYEYLRTGRVRLFDEHTPLGKALLAWPLFFVPDLPAPEDAAGWSDGDLIQAAQATVLNYEPIDRVIVPPRVAVALLTLTLAASVYRWAAHCFGPTAGLIALALLAFDPNVLAHGSLATTDVSATTFIFWAVWAFARYLRRPGSRRWWAAALLLGLAQGAKLTAALLLPVLGLLALLDAWKRGEGEQPLLRRALSFGGMVAVAAFVVWVLYLFELRALPDVAGGRPIPAASHVERWMRLRDNVAYGRESFLLGQNRMHGWWGYFPLAFALKSPLPTLLMVALALVALASGRRRGLNDELALGLFPLVYAAASLSSRINIGYRHLLPMLPFLFVSVGRIGYWILQSPERSGAGLGIHVPEAKRRGIGGGKRAVRCGLVVILVLWLCVETLLIGPHYLAYFNAIAGGADGGYRFLADSNTDWGQALKALARYQRREDLGAVKLSLFTFLDPALYGVQYEPIAPMRGAPPVLPRRFNPAPGLYAISATTLDGVPLPLPSTYDWFRHRAPLNKIAHVMFVYDVAATTADWIAQCTLPVAPLTPGAIAEGFGVDGLRQLAFDCEQSWVLPGGGASTGWYARATPGIDGLRWPTGGERLEWWPDWGEGSAPAALNLPPGSLRLSYVQPTPGELPAFAIWEWGGASIAPPATVEQGEIAFGETLAFLGYRAPPTARRGAALDVLTYWRVLTEPARPLSLMLHLSGADGAPIAVGDGLGVPVDQWLQGDIIVQRHALTIPDNAPPGAYQVRSGVYWLDDMTHLTADDQAPPWLTSITIKP